MSDDPHRTDGLSPFDLMPADLVEAVRRQTPHEEIRLAAQYDLSDTGAYGGGWLALAPDRLGSFLHRDGAWSGSWIPLAELKQAVVVEGVGMSLLRLLQDGGVRAEFRYTLRHAREMSRIHRAGVAGVPITNYGLTIAYSLGIFERALGPFPAALEALGDARA